jgi:predicted metalloendopeptidase
MPQSLQTRLAVTTVLTVLLCVPATSQGADSPAPFSSGPPPGVENNFGFPLAFDPSKMDTSVDPRQDFARYAAGRWLDVATIPGDSPYISGIVLMTKRVERQVNDLFANASRSSPSATKGTPLQQVGDLYAAGMDVEHLGELGAAPLMPEWERIAKIDGAKSLATALARLELIANVPVVIGASVGTDLEDPTRYSVVVADGDLPLPALEHYLSPELAPVREAYLKVIADSLALAGIAPAEARTRATKVLEMETRIAGKKLTPVQKRDIRAAFTRMPYAELKATLPHTDLDTLFANLGLPTSGEVLVADIGAIRERDAMLGEYSLEDTKAYLQWEALRLTSAYLSPQFIEVQADLTRALTGQTDVPKRELVVAQSVSSGLGHALGQLYVARYFPAQSRKDAEEVVGNVRAQFRKRLEQNEWLSASTRAYAIEKLDTMNIVVGYPEKWIDTSAVDVRRDDYFGNMLRLNEFAARRALARLGQPVSEDGFADTKHTLPTVVNAGYSPDRNGIEIPAAFLQPPFYDPKADVAVNYCTLGAVIGHEITHGFDSMGRLFDANGALRDWWSPADGEAFVARSRNLVEQANAFEVLPGVHLNGDLSSGENLADVGGVMLGYDALQAHLQANPQDNRKIDGFTPQQRCFLAWAQNWADKMHPGLLRTLAASDPHPPGRYRMIAPSRNLQGFYDAFGVRPGDAMWIDPAKRVDIW